MYKAIVEFYDLTDGGRKYSVGDTFPRADFVVSDLTCELVCSASADVQFFCQVFDGKELWHDMPPPLEDILSVRDKRY